jgi:hypothetical protein
MKSTNVDRSRPVVPGSWNQLTYHPTLVKFSQWIEEGGNLLFSDPSQSLLHFSGLLGRFSSGRSGGEADGWACATFDKVWTPDQWLYESRYACFYAFEVHIDKDDYMDGR